MQHERSPVPTWLRIAKVLAVASSIVIGAGLVLISVTLGGCAAFGGRCPADRPPLLEDDVFGMAVSGTALMVMVPWFLQRPSLRRLGRVVPVGLVAAFVIGLLVREIAHG